MTATLLIGGARSGKSTAAQRLAHATALPVTLFVTIDSTRAELDGDQELLERIRRHQDDRPADWTTIEVGRSLASDLRAAPDTVVIDCVTLWLSGLLTDGIGDHRIEEMVRELAAAVAAREGTTIVVTNEVGLGVVPDQPLGRTFRDVQGRANQILADAVDRVALMIAGKALVMAPLDDGAPPS